MALVGTSNNLILVSQLANTKLGRLVSVFKKYLIKRLLLTPEETNLEIDALVLVVGTLASLPKDSIEKFEPDDLFLLLAYVLKQSQWLKTYIPYIVESNYGSSVAQSIFTNGRGVQISYFGEFVYYCTSLDKHPTSPAGILIMEAADVDETNLIWEIGLECSPELGISLFIVLRNYFVATYDTKYSELILNACSYVDEVVGFDECYNHYNICLKEITLFPELSEYIEKFIVYLRSNTCLASWHFSNSLLRSEYLKDAFKEREHFLTLVGSDRYIIKVLQFLLDTLYYFRSNYSLGPLTLSRFEDLKEFFLFRFKKFKYEKHDIINHIFEEVSQILDFLIFSNFISDYSDDYYKLCIDANNLIIDYFHLSQSDVKLILKTSLFPFFGISKSV